MHEGGISIWLCSLCTCIARCLDLELVDIEHVGNGSGQDMSTELAGDLSMKGALHGAF